MKGDYEVALEKIFFSNIKTTDLGHMEITYINENSERSSYVEPIIISCETGLTYKQRWVIGYKWTPFPFQLPFFAQKNK